MHQTHKIYFFYKKKRKMNFGGKIILLTLKTEKNMEAFPPAKLNLKKLLSKKALNLALRLWKFHLIFCFFERKTICSLAGLKKKALIIQNFRSNRKAKVDPFLLVSLSKQTTYAPLLILAIEGKVSLDYPVIS